MKIFNPITNITPAPDAIDGLLSIVTRQGQNTINNAAFTTLATFNLIPNLFNVLSQNQRLNVDYFGQLIGAAGNKQIRLLFDATVLHDTGAGAFANQSYSGLLRLCAIAPPTAIRFNNYMVFATSATNAVTAQQQANSNSISIDPTIAHSITIQALNVNAGDSVTLDHLFAYIG